MKMLIDGRQADAVDGRTMDVVNPVTGQVLDQVPAAGKADIDRALAASKEGFRKWKAVPLMEKEAIFQRFYRLLEDTDTKRDIISTLIKESGSSIRNGLFQYQGMPEIFKGYLETAKRYHGSVLVPGTEAGHDGRTMGDLQMVVYEPVGTVFAVVPFNAPLMLFAYKAAPALAAGNSVVVKPPSDNPLALLKVVELLWKAGVPGDALQVITGRGSEVGDWVTSDPRVNAVSLTGSTQVGLNVAQIMAKRLAPCALELGGNDPFIVMEDADVKAAVKDAAFWRMNSAGQVCISPKRFIVHSSVLETFTKGVLEFVENIDMGYEMDVDAELEKYLTSDFSKFSGQRMVMNSLISQKAAEEVEAQVEKTAAQGARILIGGKRKGSFYEPTILTHVTKDMDVMKDMEIFGPVMPICAFDTADEAVEIANQSCYGLSGCVFTKDWKKGMEIARQVQSGTVVVNGTGTYRNMMQPFGGMKLSGQGKEGFFTLGEVVEAKNIVLKGFVGE